MIKLISDLFEGFVEALDKLDGIDADTLYFDGKMQMRSAYSSTLTAFCDDLSPFDSISFFNQKLTQMVIAAINPFAVVDDDGAAGVVALFG